MCVYLNLYLFLVNCYMFFAISPVNGFTCSINRYYSINFSLGYSGWSGGAMALGKLPVPGRPTIWTIVGQGLVALAVGEGGGVWTHLLFSIFSLLVLPLSGRRSDID